VIHRVRRPGPDGHDIVSDIDAGPGPVGVLTRRNVGGSQLTDATPPRLRASAGETFDYSRTPSMSGGPTLVPHTRR
jgi:hypothetical protein